MNGPTVPLEMVVPEWAGQDDFGGEDFACFTGTDEEKGATDALIERQREQREQQIEALKVEAPAFKAEKTWDGRTCAAPDCPDEATGERYVWGMGSLPVCDKHAGTG